MKGMVFTELLAMADDAFGEAAVDEVIAATDLPTQGAYTAVGFYPAEELLALVKGFSAHSGISPHELQRRFGHWMMNVFRDRYPGMFAARGGGLDMLSSIEDDIHVEVRKLYPDANLPSFETRRLGPDALDLTYRSRRPMADFCQGLIEACLAHFGETGTIARTDLSRGEDNVTEFRIRLDTGT